MSEKNDRDSAIGFLFVLIAFTFGMMLMLNYFKGDEIEWKTRIIKDDIKYYDKMHEHDLKHIRELFSAKIERLECALEKKADATTSEEKK